MGKKRVRGKDCCNTPMFIAFLCLQPTPIKLTLDPADLVTNNLLTVSFTAARFNIGEDIEEAWISSSTGPLIVTWNFRKVKERRRYPYKVCNSVYAFLFLAIAVDPLWFQLKRMSENVVADQFRFNREDQLVVSLPDDLYLQRR